MELTSAPGLVLTGDPIPLREQVLGVEIPLGIVLALGTAYLALASASGDGGAIVPRWGWRCVIMAAGIGVAFLTATYVFVRLMMQGSGS